MADDFFRQGWAERAEPRVRWAAALMRKAAMSNVDYMTLEEMARHPYHQELIAPHGLRWSAGVRVGAGENVWGLSLHRGAGHEPFQPEELRQLAQLSRSLAGAAELARVVNFTRIDAKLSAFERSESPVMMIDRDGEPLRLNPSAERLLGDDLKIVNRRLVSWSPDATLALDNALSRLLWRRGEVKSVVLPRKVGRPIIAYPTRLAHTPYDCFAPAQVLIIFSDLAARRRVDAQALMDGLGLSAREATLTALIAGGASLERAAERLGIAVSTARNQIKSFYHKTDTHSQGQLIALVSRLISPLTKSLTS